MDTVRGVVGVECVGVEPECVGRISQTRRLSLWIESELCDYVGSERYQGRDICELQVTFCKQSISMSKRKKVTLKVHTCQNGSQTDLV